ncbi:hypothetical protein HAX54_003628 [Datura stramonium]|uniref:Uncharacterized protein n=1 Tax=Datura stramonium TaxID=4076 RepID=A0ABS8WWV9_DATST|nr:hypothetical protein [Datura stramonium]
MSTKLTEMMNKTTTCNDLQVTILANTQEEPQVEGRIEPKKEIDRFFLSIHDLQGLLNEKVEASEAQLQSVMDTSQCIEQEEEPTPLDYYLLVDVDVEEVDKMTGGLKGGDSMGCGDGLKVVVKRALGLLGIAGYVGVCDVCATPGATVFAGNELD